jgi:hypothetical protein
MTGEEKPEMDAVADDKVQEWAGRAGADPTRLARLPLAALLYYVLYGDEGLTRLT